MRVQALAALGKQSFPDRTLKVVFEVSGSTQNCAGTGTCCLRKRGVPESTPKVGFGVSGSNLNPKIVIFASLHDTKSCCFDGWQSAATKLQSPRHTWKPKEGLPRLQSFRRLKGLGFRGFHFFLGYHAVFQRSPKPQTQKNCNGVVEIQRHLRR